MAVIWKMVLNFPRLLAGMTIPSVEARPRRPVMMISRPRMNQHHPGRHPLEGQHHDQRSHHDHLVCDRIEKLPNVVTISMRRARYPSSQSVVDATANTTVAQKAASRDGESSRTARTGIRQCGTGSGYWGYSR